MREERSHCCRMEAPVIERTAVHVPGRPRPSIPNFSPAIRWGSLLFTAGAVGTDPLTGTTSPDIKEQTRQCLENLRGILEAAGTDFDHVLKVTVYLVDMAEWEAMNQVYRGYFTGELPARSAVGVASLARRELRIEIECVAAIP